MENLPTTCPPFIVHNLLLWAKEAERYKGSSEFSSSSVLVNIIDPQTWSPQSNCTYVHRCLTYQ